MSAVVVPLDTCRVRAAAREYVRRFVEYGFESAALWSQDNVLEKDARLFTRYVKEELRKKGFSGS